MDNGITKKDGHAVWASGFIMEKAPVCNATEIFDFSHVLRSLHGRNSIMSASWSGYQAFISPAGMDNVLCYDWVISPCLGFLPDRR